MKSDKTELELRRLEAVRSFHILDTEPENEFNDLVELAANIFNVPISTITIVDSHRQWFKASVGVTFNETERNISFCRHTIENSETLVVEDTSKDSRFSENPLVLNNPHLGFYAGAPLLTSNNLAIGTFCIMDFKPRVLTISELKSLESLANQAMKLIEIRLERNRLLYLIAEIDRINKALFHSEQKWKFSLESSGDGVWEWDIKTDNTVFTRRWKEMLGYDEDDIADNYEAWISIIHPEDLENVLKNLDEYLDKKNHEYIVNYRLLCKDKTWKKILTRGMVVEWNADGCAKRMVGTHSDISKIDKLDLNNDYSNLEALTGLIEPKDEFNLLY